MTADTDAAELPVNQLVTSNMTPNAVPTFASSPPSQKVGWVRSNSPSLEICEVSTEGDARTNDLWLQTTLAILHRIAQAQLPKGGALPVKPSNRLSGAVLCSPSR